MLPIDLNVWQAEGIWRYFISLYLQFVSHFRSTSRVMGSRHRSLLLGQKTLRVRFQHSQLCVFLLDPAALGLLFFASALMTSGSERLPWKLPPAVFHAAAVQAASEICQRLPDRVLHGTLGYVSWACLKKTRATEELIPRVFWISFVAYTLHAYHTYHIRVGITCHHPPFLNTSYHLPLHTSTYYYIDMDWYVRLHSDIRTHGYRYTDI